VRSETVIITVIIVVDLCLDHVDELVIDLAWILDVQVFSGDRLLVKHGRNYVLEDSPRVLQVQIDCVGERIGHQALESDHLMRLV